MADFGLIITSDRVFRGEKEDAITPLVHRLLHESGHTLVYQSIVPNDPQKIREAIEDACRHTKIVITTGGTGISPRDITVDVIRELAIREAPGFGELHRRLSYESIGERALLSRATAFITKNWCFVAATPGNPSAVEITIRLLAPIADHLVEQLEGKPH